MSLVLETFPRSDKSYRPTSQKKRLRELGQLGALNYTKCFRQFCRSFWSQSRSMKQLQFYCFLNKSTAISVNVNSCSTIWTIFSKQFSRSQSQDRIKTEKNYRPTRSLEIRYTWPLRRIYIAVSNFLQPKSILTT